MSEAKRPLKVFLCHASQDKPVVRELSGRLASEGWIDPWVDEKKLLPGQDWRTKIEEAVETSDIVIICLSSNSVTKEGFVQKELRYAREIAFEKPDETIFLIPLRLDDCTVPRGLRFYQWGDYFGEQADETYSALLESLKLRYEQKLRLEEEERARKEKERQEHEAREEATREKAEQETAEKIAREKAEREAAERAKRERVERESAERIARQKAKREAAEKAKQEKFEHQAARKAAVTKALSRFSTKLKPALAQARPFFSFAGIIGIIIVLFWGGSLAMPRLLALIPTAMPTATATFKPTNTKRPTATKTLAPTAIKTRVPTSTSTRTPTLVPQSSILLQEDFEDGVANGWGDTKVGEWTIKEDANGNHYWSASGPSDYPQNWYGDATLDWTDYAFESRIKFVDVAPDSGQIFVCVRADTGIAFYAVYINLNNLNYAQYNPGKSVSQFGLINTETITALTLGRWYTVRVEIRGNVLSTYIDNRLIKSHSLPTPLLNTQGGIGYYMGGGDKFYIDDIRVWSLK